MNNLELFIALIVLTKLVINTKLLDAIAYICIPMILY